MLGLGIHLGSLYFLKNSYMNIYLIGSKNSYNIIDLNKTSLMIKRASSFLYYMVLNGSKVYCSYNNKHILKNYIFFKNKFFFFSFNFFKAPIGSFLNYKVFFIEFLNIILKEIINKYYKFLKKPKRIFKFKFFKIFIAVLKITCYKKRYDIHRVGVYWRCLSFIRNFPNIFTIPDVLINLDNTNNIQTDFNLLKIPVIGICENGSFLKNLTYPIPCNENSFISSFFILCIFKQIYKNAWTLKNKNFIKFNN